MRKNLLVIFTLCVTLAIAGCGASNIDAKNSDSLRQSLQSIGSDLDEAARAQLGQDFMLLATAVRKGEEKVRDTNLYTNRYVKLFKAEQSPLSRTDNSFFSQVALKGKIVFDGKSPSELHQSAQAMRGRFFARKALQATAKAEEFQKKSDDVIQNIASLKTQLTKEKTIAESLKTSRKNAVKNVRLKWEKFNKSRMTTYFSGLAEITNYSDSPINKIRFSVHGDIEDIPNYHFKISGTDHSIDPPLNPGETRKNVSFKSSLQSILGLQRDKGSPSIDHKKTVTILSSPSAFSNVYAKFDMYYSIKGTPITLKYKNESHWSLPSDQEENIFEREEEQIKRCDIYSKKLRTAADALNALAKELEALSKAPENKKTIKRPHIRSPFSGQCA